MSEIAYIDAAQKEAERQARLAKLREKRAK